MVNANVDPLPTSLSTRILPPCSSMNLREIASPRPVPSTLLRRRPDLAELLEHRGLVLGRNADAGVGDRDLDTAIAQRGANVDASALGRELQRVGQQIQQHLLHLALVGADRHRASRRSTAASVISRRCARSRMSIIVFSIAVGRWKSLRFELHASRLDLRQVEDVVDEREQVPSRVEDVAEVLRLLVVDLAEHALGQHFREADDRVERRAQLVRHVGQELALVLARHLELPALVLDLAEQPRILDGQRRLRGEGLEQLDHLRRELARAFCGYGQSAEQVVLAQQRYRQQRAIAQTEENFAHVALVAAIVGNVADLHRLAGRPPAGPARPRPCGWELRAARSTSSSGSRSAVCR